MFADVNGRVMVIADKGVTKMWLAKHMGCFGGRPEMTLSRELSYDECRSMMANPYQIFKEPSAKVFYKRPSEMTNLVERLRDMNTPYHRDKLHRESAAEIERLTEERDAAYAMSRCQCGTDEACSNLAAWHREIVALQAKHDHDKSDLLAMQRERDTWQKMCDNALLIVRDFATRNPLQTVQGHQIDPWGAHRWLDEYAARRAAT